MSKFSGRNKRWKKKVRNSRWRVTKRDMLSRGFVEVEMNLLTVPGFDFGLPKYEPKFPIKFTPISNKNLF